MNAQWTPVTGVDQPTGHPIGIALGFFGLALFFIAIFVVMAYVGHRRRVRNGPPPPPVYPILGKPREPHTKD
ncbi:hypothetical protein [Branchiibius hedensis]|uniref:hypothetical protein n=1 Tax=Branchiibius hedensis TaxID=672460 RepID=UPI0011B1EA7B|nr:hypothetical protein [Branchiibius hedensis]